MKFTIGDTVRFRRPVPGDDEVGTVVEASDTQIRVSFSGRRVTHLIDANNFELGPMVMSGADLTD